MKSAKVTAFLSCSFSDSDRDLNDYVRAIAEGLDVSCVNVSGGYTNTPPEQALEMIKEADIVLAIAPRRTKIEGSDEYVMPEAISNELSFAFGQRKPLLLIKESKVRTDGFLSNYGTYLQFDREDLSKKEFLKKSVEAIHNLKLGAISEHELLLSQEITEFVAERTSHLYELEREGDGFCWQHSVERRLTFNKTYNKPMRLSRWNDFIPTPPSGEHPPMELTFEINSSSRPFEYSIEYTESTCVGVTAAVTFSPPPGPGDWIDYYVSYRGRHMCVVYSDEITKPATLQVDDRNFTVFDGIVPVNRAKSMEIQFRFPREYKIEPPRLSWRLFGLSHTSSATGLSASCR